MSFRTENLPKSSQMDAVIANYEGRIVQVPYANLVSLIHGVSGPDYELHSQLATDLSWPAGVIAAVWGDTDELNGVYKKTGTIGTGTWERLGDLPGFTGDAAHVADQIEQLDDLQEGVLQAIANLKIGANGYVYTERSVASIELAMATLKDGDTFWMAGFAYRLDSTASHGESCTKDLGRDGVVPSGIAHIEHFGGHAAVGFNNESAISRALIWIKARKACLVFERGEYEYNAFANYIGSNTSLIFRNGSSLKYTGYGTALSFDAWADGKPADPFINHFNIENMKITAPFATTILFAQGVARSSWSIVANGTDGSPKTVGFDLRSVNLCDHYLRCSYVDGTTPYRGLFLQAGSHRKVNRGGCSNNRIVSYMEGCSIGQQLASNGADQNVFFGSAEACTRYGQVVGLECRYNTFIGIGYENPRAKSADVDDNGIYSRYINCYSSRLMRINGKGIRVEGCYTDRLEITAAAVGTTVEDVTVNNWNTGAGGFFNAGTGTRQRNIYDADSGKYVYKPKQRYSIVTPASGEYWGNDQGVPVKIRSYGGTVSQVVIKQGTDHWTEPNPLTPQGGTAATGIYLLMPGQYIAFSYSVAPELDVISQEAM